MSRTSDDRDIPDPEISAWLAHRPGCTRTAYRREAVRLLAWCRSTGRHPVMLSPADLGAFRTWLESEVRLGPASVRRALAATSSLYRHLLDSGLIRTNPLDEVGRPRGRGVPARMLGATEQTRLLRAAARSGRGDLVLVCLLMLEGWSLERAATARREDFSIVDEEARELRFLPADTLVRHIADLLIAHGAGVGTGPLLRSGEAPLGRHAAGRRLRRLARQAGLSEPVGVRRLQETARLFFPLLRPVAPIERSGFGPALRDRILLRQELADRGVRRVVVLNAPEAAAMLREELGLDVVHCRIGQRARRSPAGRRALSARLRRLVRGACTVVVDDWRTLDRVSALGPGPPRLGGLPRLRIAPDSLPEAVAARLLDGVTTHLRDG